MSMHSILAEKSVSITDLRKNPGQYFTDEPIAVLSNNRPVGYMVDQALFQEIMGLVERAEIERTVTGRFRMNANELQGIARKGADILAGASTDNARDLATWSESS